MATKPIVRMGNEQLSQPSRPVTQFSTPELFSLIQDMKDTMAVEEGVGLAAPQIGCNLRIIIFGYEDLENAPDKIPFTVLINPVIEVLDKTLVDGWEACISVPDMCGLVPRYKKIKYSGFDPEGNPISGIAEDYHARMVQHENDHLDGVLYPERIKDIRYFGYQDEIIPRIRGKKEEIVD